MDCTPQGIFYALKSLGITLKKTTTYKEQDPIKVENYLTQRATFNDHRRVYIDETGIDTYLHRPFARSPKEQPIKSTIIDKKYKRASFLAGQIGDKLIAPMTYDNIMTSKFFEKWFEEILLSSLITQSIIIMDNARFHRMKILRELAKKFGHVILRLSPYSPELNSIEKA